MSTLYDPQDDPELGEFAQDWAAKVTIVLTYDPDLDTLVVDRGKIPRTFAVSILKKIEDDEFIFDGEPVVQVEEAGADD